MAMQEDTLEVCLQQATDGSNTHATAVDMDDIALAHAHAAAQAEAQHRAHPCHECHPPAPPPPPPSQPACCPHSRTGPHAHPPQGVPPQHVGQHAGHRPVFHGWQQQMRARAAAQQKHICARGKPWNGFLKKVVEIPHIILLETLAILKIHYESMEFSVILLLLCCMTLDIYFSIYPACFLPLLIATQILTFQTFFKL